MLKINLIDRNNQQELRLKELIYSKVFQLLKIKIRKLISNTKEKMVNGNLSISKIRIITKKLSY